MAAPHGNQYAKNCTTNGRPAFDKKQIGLEFVKWATNNIDALTVPQFSSKHGIASTTMIHWCHEDDESRQSYMLGKELIGINRLKSSMLPGPVPKLSDNVYQKTLWHYDLDVRHEIRDDKKYEASLKAETEGKGNIVNVNFPNNSAAYNDGQISTPSVSKENPQCAK